MKVYQHHPMYFNLQRGFRIVDQQHLAVFFTPMATGNCSRSPEILVANLKLFQQVIKLFRNLLYQNLQQGCEAYGEVLGVHNAEADYLPGQTHHRPCQDDPDHAPDQVKPLES